MTKWKAFVALNFSGHGQFGIAKGIPSRWASPLSYSLHMRNISYCAAWQQRLINEIEGPGSIKCRGDLKFAQSRWNAPGEYLEQYRCRVFIRLLILFEGD